MDKEIMQKIGDRWSVRQSRPPRVRWWESTTIKRHISKKVVDGGTENGSYHIETLQGTGRKFSKALSIGCGNATQEIALLKSGIVEHFDLFELAPQMIMEAKANASNTGVKKSINFHYCDFFTSYKNIPNYYDLVFWNASLHHMFDADNAVKTSYEVLNDRGYFYCNEFVGKNNFQYTNLEIMIANGVRAILPKEVFKIPGTNKEWQLTEGRPNLQAMKQADPSEAADSENIIPSITKYFPDAKIIPLGGVIYNLALMNVLTNIPENCGLLSDLLSIDDDANDHGLFHYAFTLVQKK